MKKALLSSAATLVLATLIAGVPTGSNAQQPGAAAVKIGDKDMAAWCAAPTARKPASG